MFDADPPPPDDPLLALPNVVLTPHVAWLTTGTFDRSFALAAENCRRLSTGESQLNSGCVERSSYVGRQVRPRLDLIKSCPSGSES